MVKNKKFNYKFIEHESNYDWGNSYNFMEIHGYAIGRVYTLKEEHDAAYIEGLHVSKGKRNKLLGTTMINHLINKCKEIKVNECVLWCDKNKWMYKWYQRLGFKYDSEKQDQEGFVWMVKKLN